MERGSAGRDANSSRQSERVPFSSIEPAIIGPRGVVMGRVRSSVRAIRGLAIPFRISFTAMKSSIQNKSCNWTKPVGLILISVCIGIVSCIAVALTTSVGFGGDMLRNSILSGVNPALTAGTRTASYFLDDNGTIHHSDEVDLTLDGLVVGMNDEMDRAGSFTLIEGRLSWFTYPGGTWGPTCSYTERVLEFVRHDLTRLDSHRYLDEVTPLFQASSDNVYERQQILVMISSESTLPEEARRRLVEGRSKICRISALGIVINLASLIAACGLIAGLFLVLKSILYSKLVKTIPQSHSTK